ncbi:MAG: hypothetical protein IJS93_01525 [Clostridia bacterium]|nr:hypothetical protein [Clostridia bacterium]
MKKLMKYMKIAYIVVFALNALVVVAAAAYLAITYFGITPTGIWFPITLGSVAFIDLLAAVFAFGIFRLKREF